MKWFDKESKIKINNTIQVAVKAVSVHNCIQRVILAQTGRNAESMRSLRRLLTFQAVLVSVFKRSCNGPIK